MIVMVWIILVVCVMHSNIRIVNDRDRDPFNDLSPYSEYVHVSKFCINSTILIFELNTCRV